MGIRTKFNPMGGRSGGGYKAYIIVMNSGQVSFMDDVTNCGFQDTQIIIDDCFAPEQRSLGSGSSSRGSDFILLNGTLYYFDETNTNFTVCENTSGTWSKLFADGSSVTGICDGAVKTVYFVSGQPNTDTLSVAYGTWADVSASPKNIANNSSAFIFLKNTTGRLYYLQGGSNSPQLFQQQDNLTIKLLHGQSYSSYYPALSTIDTDLIYTITGIPSITRQAGQYAISIKGEFRDDTTGQLIAINTSYQPFLIYKSRSNNAAEFGSPVSVSNPLVKVTNGVQYRTYDYSYAIDNSGAIYRLTATSKSNLSMSKITALSDTWSDIVSNTKDVSNALGINNNKLYNIYNSTVTQITNASGKCVKISGSNPFLAIFEE